MRAKKVKTTVVTDDFEFRRRGAKSNDFDLSFIETGIQRSQLPRMLGVVRDTCWRWDKLAAEIVPNYAYFDKPDGTRAWLWESGENLNLHQIWVLRKIKKRNIHSVRNWLLQNRHKLTIAKFFEETYGKPRNSSGKNRAKAC
jgi:hypothetical protein